MKLKIRRSQKAGLTGKIIFMLDVMVEFSDEERALIDRYKLKNETVYAHARAVENAAAARAGDLKGLGDLIMDKVTKRIFTIGDLVSGQHIECKTLSDLLDAEEQVVSACHEVRRYLAIATSFDGSETVVDIAA